MSSGPAGLRRLLSVLLLAVFLGGGTTLPGPDALLYHWGEPGAEQTRPHVESAGGCSSHVEHCTLGRTAAGDGASLPTALPVRAHQNDRALAQPRPAPAPLTGPRGTLPQPRAPPVPLS